MINEDEINEVKEAIKELHKMYYAGNPFDNPITGLAFHENLEILFNWVGLTESLIKNNPGERSSDELRKVYFEDGN